MSDIRSKFYSLKKGVDDPYSVTIERASEIIREKGESDKKKVIKDFGDIQTSERKIRTISCKG